MKNILEFINTGKLQINTSYDVYDFVNYRDSEKEEYGGYVIIHSKEELYNFLAEANIQLKNTPSYLDFLKRGEIMGIQPDKRGSTPSVPFMWIGVWQLRDKNGKHIEDINELEKLGSITPDEFNYKYWHKMEWDYDI